MPKNIFMSRAHSLGGRQGSSRRQGLSQYVNLRCNVVPVGNETDLRGLLRRPEGALTGCRGCPDRAPPNLVNLDCGVGTGDNTHDVLWLLTAKAGRGSSRRRNPLKFSECESIALLLGWAREGAGLLAELVGAHRRGRVNSLPTPWHGSHLCPQGGVARAAAG